MENCKTRILAKVSLIDVPEKASASHDSLQPDLLYFDSILVSTGENLNDDVFLHNEMWNARQSPVFKPVDWEHETGHEIVENLNTDKPKQVVRGNQIIGVMYAASVLTKDGRQIPESEAASMVAPPTEFHIANKAVVYKYLFPNIAAKIANDARAGRLFVSMEVWFKRYDYKLGNKIVARNSETAFLDSHLRAKGGNGTYNGERVGRVLRDLTFGGVGLVANPANVDSVITSLTNAAVSNNVDDKIQGSILGELSLLNAKEALESMAEQTDMNEKVAELAKSLATKDEELKAVKTEAEKLANTVNVFSAALASGAEGIAKLIGDEVVASVAAAKPTEYMKVLHDGVSKLVEASKASAEKAEQLSKQLAELEAAKTLAEVTAKVDSIFSALNKGEATDKLKAKIVKLAAGMSVADRDEYLKDTAELLSLAEKPAFMKEKDKEKKMEEECASEEEADASILDHVKAQAGVLPAGSSDVGNQDLTERMKTLANALLSYGKDSQEDGNGSRS